MDEPLQQPETPSPDHHGIHNRAGKSRFLSFRFSKKTVKSGKSKI